MQKACAYIVGLSGRERDEGRAVGEDRVTPKDGFLVAFLVLQVNILFYSFAWNSSEPVKVFINKDLGGTAVSYGWYQALFGVVQMFGGLALGFIVDRMAAVYSMHVCLLSTALHYLLNVFSTNFFVFYSAQVATLLVGTMQVAQSFVLQLMLLRAIDGYDHGGRAETDETAEVKVDSAVRATVMGRCSVFYAIAAVSGTALSGVVAERAGARGVMVGAAAITALALLANFFLLPVVHQRKSEEASQEAPTTGYMNIICNNRPALLVLIMKFCFDTVMVIVVQTMMPVVLTGTGKKHMAGEALGKREFGLWSAVGILLAALGNLAVVPLVTRTNLKETGSLRVLCVVNLVFIVTFTVLAFSHTLSLAECLAGFLAVAFCTAVLETVALSALSGSVSPGEVGAAVALSHAVRSLTSIGSPLMAGYILEHKGIDVVLSVTVAPALVATLVAILGLPQDLSQPVTIESEAQVPLLEPPAFYRHISGDDGSDAGPPRAPLSRLVSADSAAPRRRVEPLPEDSDDPEAAAGSSAGPRRRV